jgi:hypothetical protein
MVTMIPQSRTALCSFPVSDVRTQDAVEVTPTEASSEFRDLRVETRNLCPWQPFRKTAVPAPTRSLVLSKICHTQGFRVFKSAVVCTPVLPDLCIVYTQFYAVVYTPVLPDLCVVYTQFYAVVYTPVLPDLCVVCTQFYSVVYTPVLRICLQAVFS